MGLLAQRLMNKSDGQRAFTHAGSYSLDAARSYITCRKDSGNARFEKVGLARKGPAGIPKVFICQVWSS